MATEENLTPENKFHLEQIERMEKELSENDYNAVSRVYHHDFLRAGLPIIVDMISDNFQPQLWAEYTGSVYAGLEVLDQHTGEVIYKLPPLLKQGLTVIPIEERDSLSSEAEYHIQRSIALNTNTSGEILDATTRALEDCYGTLENATIDDAIQTMETLTKILSDAGYGEDALGLAEDIKEAKEISANGAKPTVETEQVDEDKKEQKVMGHDSSNFEFL